MKLPQLTLRDLFWLVLVAAIVSFGFAREATRAKHVRGMEARVDHLPTILYPAEFPVPGEEYPLGMLGDGESLEVVAHKERFDYTIKLKSRGEIVEKRFTVQGRSCGVKTPAAPP
jgi:hypothetical protein